MVANTNKEPTSGETASTATVGGGTGGRKLAQKPGRPYDQLLSRLVKATIVLALITFALVLITNFHGSTVFTINDKNYSKSDVKKLVAYQTEKRHISFQLAAKNAYSALSYQAAAKNAHIPVTRAEEDAYIASSLGPSDSTYKQYKSWFDLAAYNGVVKSKLPAADNNREGYSYVFWFGDAIQPAFSSSSLSPKYGSQPAYKADQQYASQKANYYHDQLQSKKMTPDQVLTAVKNDPKLAPNGLIASNPTTHFGTGTNAQNTWQLQLSNNTIESYVVNAAANSLSPVRTGLTATKLAGNSGGYEDAYYYIVQMQNVQPNNGKLLKQAQADLHAKFYELSAWL